MTIAPILLAFMAQASTPPVPAPAPAAPQTVAARYEKCVDLATGNDPAAGIADAQAWAQAGGTYFARQCRGIALTNLGHWADAAQEFEGAANEAEVAHDSRASRYWAQAGNAWLAAGDPAKARSALDAALGAGTLEGQDRGEASFDRARALVAIGNLPAARIDMDVALKLAGNDALIWLSSATLARKMRDIPHAKHDVIMAYRLAPDDPSVDLEIGNIAAAGGDMAGARMAWGDAARLGGDTPVGKSAREALKQLDTPQK